MKTATKIRKNVLAAVACALGCAFMYGCMNSNPSSPSTTNSSVTGRVEGDGALAKKASDSLQGVIVTAFEINSNGSRGAQMAQDTTDANGNFTLTTSAQGSQNWLLVATQGTMQWMSRFNDTLKQGKTDTARPLDFEGTLQTQVYLALQASGSGQQVRSGEITAAIDLSVSSSYRSQYESADSAARVALAAQLAAAVQAQSQARSAYLSLSDASYSSDTASESGSMRQAEANLNFALYNANGDSTQTRQAESVYLQAVISAYAKSDSAALSYARAGEAAYQATLMATASDTSNSMSRRSLHIMAVSSDTAMQREFSLAGATQSQWQAVVTASANYQSEVDTSNSNVSRDTSTSRYRAALKVVFQSQDSSADSAFIKLLNLSTTGTLFADLQSYSTSLQASLAVDASSDNATGMGQTMENSNAQAEAQILTQWNSSNANNTNTARNSAMAQIMAFLTVSSNSSHNGS